MRASSCRESFADGEAAAWACLVQVRVRTSAHRASGDSTEKRNGKRQRQWQNQLDRHFACMVLTSLCIAASLRLFLRAPVSRSFAVTIAVVSHPRAQSRHRAPSPPLASTRPPPLPQVFQQAHTGVCHQQAQNSNGLDAVLQQQLVGSPLHHRIRPKSSAGLL